MEIHLVEFAGSGEKASAGSVHYDNVAASVLGGFVIVKTNPLEVIRIEPPTNFRMCCSSKIRKYQRKNQSFKRSNSKKDKTCR